MKMKTYTASNMIEAMETIRDELGEDAIIVSSQEAPDGSWVRVTAALEDIKRDNDIENAIEGESFTQIGLIIREALEYHNVCPTIKEKLVNLSHKVPANEPDLCLAGAIEDVFSFDKIKKHGKNTIMLIGFPGAGKTSAVAKLAAFEKLNEKDVNVITADAIRAGASEQLSAFTNILEVDLKKVRGPNSLKKQIDILKSSNADTTIIDCPGINPFSEHDIDFLIMLKEASKAEPIIVMPAGLDPDESVDIACILKKTGAKKLIATKLDTSRRIGGIISAVGMADLSFCEVSISPHIADGFCPLTPMSLAKLLLPKRNASSSFVRSEYKQDFFEA